MDIQCTFNSLFCLMITDQPTDSHFPNLEMLLHLINNLTLHISKLSLQQHMNFLPQNKTESLLFSFVTTTCHSSEANSVEPSFANYVYDTFIYGD